LSGGTQKLSAVATSIKQVSAGAQRLKILVDEVNVGSQEQSKGLEQISGAIAQQGA